jgi:hypothetical protein
VAAVGGWFFVTRRFFVSRRSSEVVWAAASVLGNVWGASVCVVVCTLGGDVLCVGNVVVGGDLSWFYVEVSLYAVCLMMFMLAYLDRVDPFV